MATYCAEAVPGIPEIEEPEERMKRYWESSTVRDAFPSSVKTVIEARHFPMMHDTRSGNFELGFVGACYHTAAELMLRGR